MPTPKGLFFGLATVDLQYLVDEYPEANTKNKAGGFTMQSGGPASNAAVAFAHLGGAARLHTVIGRQPFRDFMVGDLEGHGVEVIDMAAGTDHAPTLSSVVTERTTGSRTIFNSTLPFRFDADGIGALWRSQTPDVVLIDGFLFPAALDVARYFKDAGVPVVFDGGSWKDATPQLLDTVTHAICSENFHPPGTDGTGSVIDHLASLGIENIAVTRGERTIVYRHEGASGEIPVPATKAVDTLGAGDIFHGAFAYFLATGHGFVEALGEASVVAARSCASFGTRAWMALPAEAG